MLTLRAAALALSRADSFEALRPLARALGFLDTPVPLSAALRRELGIHAFCDQAALHVRPGGLRLLVATLTPPDALQGTGDLRERALAVATALKRVAPTGLWCLCLLDHTRQHLCLAAVIDHARGLRLTALRVDCRRVLDSDADTLRSLAAITETDAHAHHARLADILGRDALSRRFYRELEQRVGTLAQSLHTDASRRHSARSRQALLPTPAERRELALLTASRCLFLSFLEAKGWLDARRDFLLHEAVRVLESGGGIHARVLRPLFFGTLNTPRRHRATEARRFGAVPFLNGGLFSPTALERRHHHLDFSDDALTALLGGLLDRYRFTAREESSAWSEAAVDPEMLGRAFEGLMAEDERKRSGSFYTPPHLVAQAVDAALACSLEARPGQDTPAFWTSLRVLDPACGSGAFLVQALETLDARAAAAGDPRSEHERRRAILARCIFGVDKQPMAVWLCELRLWLSVVIACDAPRIEDIAPLPNLDHHIRVGDALTGGTLQFAAPSAGQLARLRERYARATGPRKLRTALSLDAEERERAITELSRHLDALRRERRQLVSMLRGRDLFGQRRRPARADVARLDWLRQRSRELQTQRHRLQLGGALPFRFASMFADVAAAGGFDLLVGNPPWVRPHAMAANERTYLRTEFRAMRHATWRVGASRAGAGAGFAAQADLAVAFVERAVQLLRPGATLALLLPAKLWRNLSGGGVRRLLLHDTHIRALHDWSDAPALFDAATYPSLLVAQRRQPADARASSSSKAAPSESASASMDMVHCVVTRDTSVRFAMPSASLSLEADDPAAPWVLLPPAARVAFDALRHAGPPLADSPLGRPLLGVKCGCNAAFLVHAVEHHDDGATVTSLAASTPTQGVIERAVLRPALRGEALVGPVAAHTPGNHAPGNDAPGNHAPGADTPRHSAQPDEHDVRIIWTHDAFGKPLAALPPATARWLGSWRPRLRARRDARQSQPWWTLFRTDAARADLPRLVWADIGRQLRLRLLPPHDPTVPLNTCYVLRLATLDDAYAALALLSSDVAAAWLDVLAEPARGGFRRYLGWTVGALPVPQAWPRVVADLAPLGKRLHAGEHLPAPLLNTAVARAYGLSLTVITPLLAWHQHAPAQSD